MLPYPRGIRSLGGFYYVATSFSTGVGRHDQRTELAVPPADEQHSVADGEHDGGHPRVIPDVLVEVLDRERRLVAALLDHAPGPEDVVCDHEAVLGQEREHR